MIAAAAYDNWIGLALAVVALGYLIAVLVFPERF
jgi:K+-transporting ATPase KdpF subunit